MTHPHFNDSLLAISDQVTQNFESLFPQVDGPVARKNEWTRRSGGDGPTLTKLSVKTKCPKGERCLMQMFRGHLSAIHNLTIGIGIFVLLALLPIAVRADAIEIEGMASVPYAGGVFSNHPDEAYTSASPEAR